MKGVQFQNHEIVGEVVELAQRYAAEGADELVFYDITASSDRRTVTSDWVEQVARVIDIPFCVAGGIRAVADAEHILHSGADKISINSPALENPRLIGDIAEAFGTQCIVVGIDSKAEGGDWFVYQYTGDPDKTRPARRRTLDWIREAADRGAGEVVLNCMNQDGMRQGYDLPQLAAAREAVTIPIVASGGAGALEHFRDVFRKARVDAALAASVFHKGVIAIADLKAYLAGQKIPVRQ